MQQLIRTLIATWPVLLSTHTLAEIDLRNAEVSRLDNGLTVILLEDRNFPVVSTQMLYRIGARDESYGQTGIAHFLEHMAFRASENFPDTGLVSSIYAVGGEWHGYTWTDQTTYFATVPKEHLDLLLRIEADRMTSLEISSDLMEAERGAVLAEMHMYENYATSMLIDAVMFTSFLAHPYRNNTIGWESDIEGLRHEEVVAFYERHYHPANAVLAVVGDFDRANARARIEELFGEVQGRAATPLPRTVEPLQQGERRVRLNAPSNQKRFMIAYRAPSVNHADYAAFLVLQEVLGAGSGVNFRQNDWGTPVGEGSMLEGVADDMTTWYPPSAQDYVFIIGGAIARDAGESQLVESIEERLARVRMEAPGDSALAAAVAEVLDELVYDVETTEDAAHQLAFFEGLRALGVLLDLPERVAALTAADVQRVARTYLLPERRTIGWHVPDERPAMPDVQGNPSALEVTSRPPVPVDTSPVPLPVVRELSGGIPVILQASDVSPTAWLQVVLRGTGTDFATQHSPVPGYSSLTSYVRARDLSTAVREARAAIDAGTINSGNDAVDNDDEPSQDPETRLEQTFLALMNSETRVEHEAAGLALIVVSGDVETEETIEALERHFGDLEPASQIPSPHGEAFRRKDIEVHLDAPVAQAQLGYIVPAPAPQEDAALAWRILLYMLSHGYEGRLGKEAISNRGLAYYIDSRYRSDGESGWITLAVGVDPDKLAALKDLMKSELQGLRDDPPTIGEIEEAKRHFLGRARSAVQSNEELSSILARQWLWYDDVLTPKALDRKLGAISRQDVLDVVPAFVDGATVVVDRF
ncbi:MAG TPA: insulinase family protein [Woeseiaceae bacterium]|nr:insulinase family protein [Woeseiaceae bacterium]